MSYKFTINSLTVGGEDVKDTLVYFNIETSIYDFEIRGSIKLAQNNVTIPLDTLKGQPVSINCQYVGDDVSTNSDAKGGLKGSFQLEGNYVINSISNISESKGLKSFTIGFCDKSSILNGKSFMEGEKTLTGSGIVQEAAEMIQAAYSGTHAGVNTFKMYIPKKTPYTMMKFAEARSTNGIICDGKIFRKLKGAKLCFDSWPMMAKGGSSSNTHMLYYSQSGGVGKYHNIERYDLDKIYNTLDFAISGGCGIEFHAIDLSSGRILQVPIVKSPTEIASLCGIDPSGITEFAGKTFTITKATGFLNVGEDMMYSSLHASQNSDKPIADPPLSPGEVDILAQAYATRKIVESLCQMQHVSFELTYGMDIDIGDLVYVESDSSVTNQDYKTIFNPSKLWYVDSVKHIISKKNCISTVGAASASMLLENP